MDIVEALDGPHEWGYRGLAGDGFIHDPAPNNAAREIQKLRSLLEPFAEIARRLKWDQIGDDDMELGDHVIEAPADDIAPGAAYCLMVGAFREAARALGQSVSLEGK